MMKAWVIKSEPTIGGLKDVVELVDDLPIPEPKNANEMIVKTHVSAIAIDDIRTAENRFLPMYNVSPSASKPFIPGHECGGVVTKVFEGETKFKVGDHVYGVSVGVPPGNAWAEYTTMPTDTTGKVPSEWTMAQAVASITGASVGKALIYKLPEFKEQDKLEGKIVVVIGASSSIGSAVVQWLVERKARVWGVCSGGKAELVTKLGAETILDYTKGPWEEQLPRINDSEGPVVDHVLDFVGGPKEEVAAKKALKKTSNSMFITVVGPVDDPNAAMGWGTMIAHVSKIFWRTKTWRKPGFAWAVQDHRHDNSTPALGTTVKPLIDREVDGWDKTAVADAIERVNSRRAAGRVLLKFA